MLHNLSHFNNTQGEAYINQQGGLWLKISWEPLLTPLPSHSLHISAHKYPMQTVEYTEHLNDILLKAPAQMYLGISTI